jgi:hypothetical protein
MIMNFSTNYEVSKTSFFDFMKFATARATKRASRNASPIITVVVFLVTTLFFIFLFQGGGSLFSSLNWGSVLIGAVPSILFIAVFLQQTFAMQKNMAPKDNGILLGPRELEISENGIRESHELAESLYSWNLVEEVVENNGDFYVFFDTVYALIIPSEAFSAEAELNKFKDCIDKYV